MIPEAKAELIAEYIRRANLYRWWALETPSARVARVLNREADRMIDGALREARTP